VFESPRGHHRNYSAQERVIGGLAGERVAPETYTAKVFGLTIAPSLLARADQVIE
jgi:hypothetical protein